MDETYRGDLKLYTRSRPDSLVLNRDITKNVFRWRSILVEDDGTSGVKGDSIESA